MACDDLREFLLDLGLNEPARRRAAEALAHVEACATCRAALHDYDTIAATLRAAGELPAEEFDSRFSGGASPTRLASEERMESPPPAASGRSGPLLPGRALSGPVLSAPAPSAARHPRPVFGYLRIPGAIAAAVVLAALGFFAGRTGFGTGVPYVRPPVVSAMPAPTPEEVAGAVEAFNQIDATYDGLTHWVAMTSAGVEIGLPEVARTAAAQKEPQGGRLLLVRLRLLRGGDVVSDADLVIVAGQTAELAVPTTAGPSLRYRVVTSANAPDRVELRAEMRSADNATTAVAALATRLQLRSDIAISAGQLVTPGGAYELAISYGSPL